MNRVSVLFLNPQIRLCVALLLCSGVQAIAVETESKSMPNIIVILADDLGYGDLACYGHKVIKTPNIDRFAKEGLRLTSCYSAAPNCSPARTGLMTGRTPLRVGIHNWIPMSSPMHVRRNEITVATLLREAGYATCHVGKWHLNGMFNSPQQPQPSDHGFDHWFSTQNNALPNHRNPDNFVRNGKTVGKLSGYAAPIVASEAIGWLKTKRDKSKPFFLYICFHEPHEPIASDEQFTRLYSYPDDPSRAAHHGNVTQMDHAFGSLMDAVDQLKLRDNTLIFFTSDNGPAITSIHPHGSAGPLRMKKGYMYEGGIRVPGIVRWPGHTTTGQESDEPVSGVDVLPTLCALADVEVPDDRTIDGTSFLPILDGQPIERKTPLYWQFNSAGSEAKVAMRDGDWKILATLTGPEIKQGGDIRTADMKSLKEAELDSFELYNLRDDIGEDDDLASKQPDRLRELSGKLRVLYREVRDESPVWPEWEWPKYESKRIEWPSYRGKRQVRASEARR